MDGIEHSYYYDGGNLVYETRGEKVFGYEYEAYGNLTKLTYHMSNGVEAHQAVVGVAVVAV